jgi:hypothetical protein
MLAISIVSPLSIWNTIKETAISIIPKITMPAILWAVPKRRTTHSKRVKVLFNFREFAWLLNG